MSTRKRYGLAVAIIGLLIGAAAAAWADWAWENGGLEDLSTGVVWSQSQLAQTNSLWTWDAAQTRARNYVTYDASGKAYGGWTVPTIKQLQAAIADGSLNQDYLGYPPGHPLYGYGGGSGGSAYVWTSESRGNKGWAVLVAFDGNGNVIGGGQAALALKGSGYDNFFVRVP